MLIPIAVVYMPLPPMRFSVDKAEELGNKMMAKLALLNKRKEVIPIGSQEWYGLNALERDDEL